MKISFSQSVVNYNNYFKSEKPKVSVLAPSFTANPKGVCKDLTKVGAEVLSDAEYKKLLDKVYSYTCKDGKPLYNAEYNLKNYPKIKKDQEGLLLYAGCSDISDDMNRFLSHRDMRRMAKEQAKDVIKVFDYSLKKLDDKFGKYSGFVFRQGVFPSGQHQYISTTTDPVIAATLRGGICTNKNMEFSLIKAKNGHKINEFQRKMGSDYAQEEEEILLSRKAKIREIKTPYGQFLTLKNKFKKLLETYAHQEINPDKIRVFEEV